MAELPEVVLMADEAVAALPVQECGEPLIESPIPFTGHKDDGTGDALRVRLSVGQRLMTADALLPDAVGLALHEGYRPRVLQSQYFEGYAEELRRLHPDQPAPEIHRLASRYVSPPDLAPHTAGAAVDVVLLDAHGGLLDLGCPINASPEASAGRCYTDHPDVEGQGAAHRRLLVEAMTAAGFVNYPTEWWHWSYGDRYWALVSGAPAALYGPCS